MQYLKESVREAIIEAAVNEFFEKSYKSASMRSIAQNAGITVGNVYRYFKSKDEIFCHITDPVWMEVKKIIFTSYDHLGVKGSPDIPEIISSLMTIYRCNYKEVFILLHRSDDSKYANVKGDLVKLIAMRIKEEISHVNISIGDEASDKACDNEDDFIFKIISNSIVESVYIIMKEFKDDFNRVQTLIEKTITVMIKDLQCRL